MDLRWAMGQGVLEVGKTPRLGFAPNMKGAGNHNYIGDMLSPHAQCSQTAFTDLYRHRDKMALTGNRGSVQLQKALQT